MREPWHPYARQNTHHGGMQNTHHGGCGHGAARAHCQVPGRLPIQRPASPCAALLGAGPAAAASPSSAMADTPAIQPLPLASAPGLAAECLSKKSSNSLFLFFLFFSVGGRGHIGEGWLQPQPPCAQGLPQPPPSAPATKASPRPLTHTPRQLTGLSHRKGRYAKWKPTSAQGTRSCVLCVAGREPCSAPDGTRRQCAR